MKPTHVYFLAPKFSYNKIERGLSYEFQTIYKSLKEATCAIKGKSFYFDVYQINNHLDLLAQIKADNRNNINVTVIYCPFTGQLKPEFYRKFRDFADTGILFLDDTWRTKFVESYIGSCDWFTTSDPHYQHRYKNVLSSKPIYFPFGYDGTLAQKYNRPFHERDIEISFLGSKDNFRNYVARYLEKKGLNVSWFGAGWPNGTIDNETFYEILGRTKISLNLSNSSSWDLRFLARNPVSIAQNLRSKKTIEQFKARHLEIAALGSCQISFYTQGLEKILTIGSDIAIYNSIYEIPDIVSRLSFESMQELGTNGNSRVKRLSYQDQFKKILAKT